MTFIRFIVAAVVAAIAVPSSAAVVFVTSPGALGANDVIDWGQLGPTFTVINTPFGVTSNGGVGATVNSAGGALQRRDQGSGWAGNFGPGEELIWTSAIGPDISVSFASPVFGAGAQIQADDFGSFIARISGVDSVTGAFSFTQVGISTAAGDDSAIYIGVLSDTQTITSLVFTLDVSAFNPNSVAIGQLDLNTTVVPEPASWALMIAGFGLVGATLRRRADAFA